jgi:phosphomannomutase/phosphoglucomutase
MLKTNTLLGLEENGGFMYGFLNHVRDGCMATVLMMEMMSSCKESLSELIASLPITYQYKSKLKYANRESIQLLVKNITSHGSPKKIENLDGAKIWIDDETWIMVRASGTEPLLRIYGESTDKSLLNSKINEYTKVINDNFKVE